MSAAYIIDGYNLIRFPVVTGDMTDIGVHLRGLRLVHLTSRELAAILARRLRRKSARERPPEEAEGKPAALSAAEVDDWVRRFGFGPRAAGGSPGGAGP
ncbi:MAG: hypothetical protein HY721_00205 [Planctomycetes bacterium]|nr:hypothetical protein [Planctomycetota bacterium]